MKKYLVPLIVVTLAAALLDPFMLLMPKMAFYFVTASFFILFVLYAVALWNEKIEDEREYTHRAFAGRVAYLSGATVLVLGILYQAFIVHTVDPWLVLALSVMVVAKFFGLWHAESTG